MNWYKNHTVYEFILYNLYNNCMNSFVWIRTKISEKKLDPGWDFNPGPISRLQSSLCLPATTPPPLSVAILFIYRTIKKTIRKMRLYKFIRVAYSQPLFLSAPQIESICGTARTLFGRQRLDPNVWRFARRIAFICAELSPMCMRGTLTCIRHCPICLQKE